MWAGSYASAAENDTMSRGARAGAVTQSEEQAALRGSLQSAEAQRGRLIQQLSDAEARIEAAVRVAAAEEDALRRQLGSVTQEKDGSAIHGRRDAAAIASSAEAHAPAPDPVHSPNWCPCRPLILHRSDL